MRVNRFAMQIEHVVVVVDDADRDVGIVENVNELRCRRRDKSIKNEEADKALNTGNAEEDDRGHKEAQ